ncbi:hypothetical protein U4W02_24335 [Escherichia coli]|nr:hypothetical protein [Escherichia coli]
MQIVVNPGVITVVLYISEIISMATVDNFDVEELFVKQNSYPKVINVMKISYEFRSPKRRAKIKTKAQ